MIAKLQAAWKAIQKARNGLSRLDRSTDKLRDRIILRRIDKSAKLLLLSLLLPFIGGCRTSSVAFLEDGGIRVPWYEKAALNVCDGVSRLNTWVGTDREDD